MKRAFFLFAFFLLATGIHAQQKIGDLVKPNAEKYDFGKIVQDKPVTYTFEIANISTGPVIVENTSANCGCTIPEKILDPIWPGKSAPLKVQYSAATLGAFNKEVFVKVAGVDQPLVLHIKGEVLTPEAYEAWKKGGK